MRALPIAALLLLAACATRPEPGLSNAQPGVNVAEAALRGGSPQVALQIDEAILARDPHNVPALINRGDALVAQHLNAAAADSYAAALQFDARSVPARIALGRIRLSEDPVAAERLFVEVLQSNPRNAVAQNDLGISLDLQGRHAEAQAAYRQAIGLDAMMIGARVNLALSMAMDGRASDAAPMMRSLAAAPSAPRKFQHDLAAVLAMGGNRVDAQHILAKDLPPEQVDQALAIFAGAPGSAPPTAAAMTSSATPAATAVATPAEGAPSPPGADAVPVAVAPVAPPVPPARVVATPAAPQAATPQAAKPLSAIFPAAKRLAATSVVWTRVAAKPAPAALASVMPVVGVPVAVAPARAMPVPAAPVAIPLVTMPFVAIPVVAAPLVVPPVVAPPVPPTPMAESPLAAEPVVATSESAPASPASAAAPVTTMPARSSPASAAGDASVTSPAASPTVSRPQPDPAVSAMRSGRVMVQLASEPSSLSADAMWQHLVNRMPALLNNRAPAVARVELQGQIFWRVRTGGFGNVTEAGTFCQEVKAKGANCYVTGS